MPFVWSWRFLLAGELHRKGVFSCKLTLKDPANQWGKILCENTNRRLENWNACFLLSSLNYFIWSTWLKSIPPLLEKPPKSRKMRSQLYLSLGNQNQKIMWKPCDKKSCACDRQSRVPNVQPAGQCWAEWHGSQRKRSAVTEKQEPGNCGASAKYQVS